jgi:hypothetical protein
MWWRRNSCGATGNVVVRCRLGVRVSGTPFRIGREDGTARAPVQSGLVASLNRPGEATVSGALSVTLPRLSLLGAFGQFGTTPVQHYSRFIRAILPDDGCIMADGMWRISRAPVLSRIEHHIRKCFTKPRIIFFRR